VSGREKDEERRKKEQEKKEENDQLAPPPPPKQKHEKTHWTPLQTVQTKMLKLVTTYCGPWGEVFWGLRKRKQRTQKEVERRRKRSLKKSKATVFFSLSFSRSSHGLFMPFDGPERSSSNAKVSGDVTAVSSH